MGRNPVRKTHAQMKAEMLLSNFNEHSEDVRQRILEMLVEAGLSRNELIYYAKNRQWPESSAESESFTFNDYTDEILKRSQRVIIKRNKAAIRNIAVFGGLVFAFFILASVMIFSGDDKSEKTVDAISIEEPTSTVKDGDSL
ncbi:MAG: hypothetical protein ACTSX1_15735 [Candidatus Heimdallarchaeaceae archaeon]